MSSQGYRQDYEVHGYDKCRSHPGCRPPRPPYPPYPYPRCCCRIIVMCCPDRYYQPYWDGCRQGSGYDYGYDDDYNYDGGYDYGY